MSDVKQVIPMFFVTNWDMVGYTATTMASILSNTKHPCDFYVLDCGMSDFDQKQMASLKDRFSNLKSISFYKVDMTRFEGLNVWYYGMLDAWAALLFPEAFPDFHGKIIHVESDTIVIDDIAKLYNEDMEDYTIAACPEIAFGSLSDIFPDKDHVYFNLGMIMIDCDKWRKDGTTEKCLGFGKQYGKRFNCLHQDALNMLYYHNHYKQLPNRYNLGERKNYAVFLHEELSDEYFAEEWKHPVLIHFSPNKPWRTQHSFYDGKRIVKYFNEWWHYASMTPYFEGMQNAFLAKRVEDEIAGLKTGIDNYGNSLLDTLPEGHPFRGIQGEGVFVDYKRNIFAENRSSSQPVVQQTVVREVNAMKKDIPFTKHYKFLGMPILKVYRGVTPSVRFKLFNFLPILKITEKKNKKYYKLFNFLTIFKVAKRCK